MKKRSLPLLLIMLLTAGGLAAQEHRIGIGLGSVSGQHEQYNEAVDLRGELLELPAYTYVAGGGLMIGFRLMEFSLNGSMTSGSQQTDITFRQTLLAASIGLEIPLAGKVALAPQIVKSYFGNSRFHYSIYNTYTSYPGYPYQYVAETDTIEGTADLSGWEIPVYYLGDFFFFGVKYSSYRNATEVAWTNGSLSEVTVSSAISIVLDASF